MIIFTIGHSTRSLEKFIEILRGHGIETLIDIRTIPKSKHNPQFNLDFLRVELPAEGITYLHMKKLGGLRHAQKDSINDAWENPSFRGYADHMQTAEFETAIEELISSAANKKTAIMCAEGNPYRCHRSLVADSLTARGIEVRHISSARSASTHRMTPFAKVNGKRVTYPHE